VFIDSHHFEQHTTANCLGVTMSIQFASWTSDRGLRVSFEVHRIFDRWLDVPGVYLMCARQQDGTFQPLYIGETESFQARLCNHEDWPVSAAYGATVVLAAVVRDRQQRAGLELLLISELHPPLNKLLREPLGLVEGIATSVAAAMPHDLTRGLSHELMPPVVAWRDAQFEASNFHRIQNQGLLSSASNVEQFGLLRS
jgi:hypothetical protein